MTNNSLEDLIKAKICRNDSIEIYNIGTRDDEKLKVYKDKISGAIFITDFDPDYELYCNADFLNDRSWNSFIKMGLYDFGLNQDCNRRVSSLKHLYSNKVIADFGCGTGFF